MSKRLNLTPAQMDLLRRIEGGQRQAHDDRTLTTLVTAGLVASMRLGRGKTMGVSITHKGRRVALGMAPAQGEEQ
jgi:hypothetical protein